MKITQKRYAWPDSLRGHDSCESALSMLSKHSIIYMFLKSGYNFADKLIGSNYIIFLKSNGLSSSQIGVILSITNWVVCILDFPTGNLSDLKGRKKTSICGLFIFGIGLIVYGMGSCFWHFVIALGLTGLGCAFTSGSLAAWYIDELKNDNIERESVKVFALSNGIAYSLSAIAGVCATFLLFYNMRLPFLVGGSIACAVAVTSGFFMRENYGEQNERYSDFIKNTLSIIFTSKKLGLYIIMQMVSGIGFVYFVSSWQPYLVSYGLPNQWLGLIFTIMMLVVSVSGFVVAGFIDEKRVSAWLLLGMILMAVAFVLMYFSPNIYCAVISVLVFQISFCVKMSANATWINKNIESNRRASLLSAISTFSNFAQAIFFIVVGYLIDNFSIKTGLLFPFVGCVSGILIFVMIIQLEKRCPIKTVPGSMEK